METGETGWFSIISNRISAVSTTYFQYETMSFSAFWSERYFFATWCTEIDRPRLNISWYEYSYFSISSGLEIRPAGIQTCFILPIDEAVV